jgi:hypothetical protein
MNSARVSVARVITESEMMIMILRFTRSAQTPAKIETIACGRKPNTAARARIVPDLVVKVRCHKIAYCTSIDPKVVTV